MPETIKYVAKVKLSNGNVYTIKDPNALKTSGGTLTGDLEVDTLIKTQHLYIMETQYIESPVTNVLTVDETTGEIKKRDADNLLEDIDLYHSWNLLEVFWCLQKYQLLVN